MKSGIFQEFWKAQGHNWAELEQKPCLDYAWAVASEVCVGGVGAIKRASEEVKRSLVVGGLEASLAFLSKLILQGFKEGCVA